MTDSAVIRCPHRSCCMSSQGTDEILCKAFDPAVKAEVVRRGLCPEAVGAVHAQATVDRFEQAAPGCTVVADGAVDVDAHVELEGDENDD